MIPLRKSASAVLASSLLVAACGGSQNSAATDSASPGARPELTADACETSGGTVIGDIGDGKIHSPEYRCANGAEPTGTIAPPAEGPRSIEGSVCCPQ